MTKLFNQEEVNKAAENEIPLFPVGNEEVGVIVLKDLFLTGI